MEKEIVIDLYQKKDYIGSYNHKKLNSNLLSYILDESKGMSKKGKIKIMITHYYDISEKEKKDFVSMLHSSLEEDIRESYMEVEYKQIRSLILMLIGIIFIIFYFCLPKMNVISEILLIIGWVGIWEACDILPFDQIQNRFKIQRYKKLMKADISFYKAK